MTLLPLLNCGAVPFAYPDNDHTIAARRFRSARLGRHFRTQADVQQQVDHHLLMTTVLSEAEAAFQSILDPRRDEINGTSNKTPTHLLANPLPPPNSPNDSINFDFPQPDIINPDPFPQAVPISSSEEDEDRSKSSANQNLPAVASAIGLRRRRSLRKRRRVPSFKNKQAPRVEPKFMATEEEYADDEASESEEEKILAFITTATSQMNTKEDGDERDYPTSELQLKLQVLSEAQKAVDSSGEEALKNTDWAKVGAELRHIADRFSNDRIDELDAPSGTLVDLNRPGGFDLVSMIDLMLPFSVPHSLWSALVSYAAWKIFKRFQ